MTPEQIEQAEVILWREGRQRGYAPGAELIGNDRVVSQALREYASVLSGGKRVVSADALVIETVDEFLTALISLILSEHMGDANDVIPMMAKWIGVELVWDDEVGHFALDALDELSRAGEGTI